MNRNQYYNEDCAQYKRSVKLLFTVIAILLIIIFIQQYKLWTADDVKVIRHTVQRDGTHTVEFSYRDTVQCDSLTDEALQMVIKGIKLPISK